MYPKKRIENEYHRAGIGFKNHLVAKGRNTSSKNKFDSISKEHFEEVLSPTINNAFKMISALPPDQRLKEVRKFCESLIRYGNPQIKDATCNTLFEQLEPHLKKVSVFFNHIPTDKQFTELRLYLKLFDKKRISLTGALFKKINRS